ncbi:hypothetical protein [Geomesophilobacter sediminis]|uniref:Type II secretion system protein GspE N-terminal domain-containing protein n=1 Tax=Geomesophilobacter sediminis TaxID=2798584 RepID=A0A8J7JMB2_9BACT|nr:hypothetical protein [Geomesophilobacter sediminis]MBJ6725675.1 hypothetical protein [Geomesophilobacter sediminis]
MKLGEALIQAGKLTASQLEEVLKEQAIFGGKFGTNLIEMGFIEEEAPPERPTARPSPSSSWSTRRGSAAGSPCSF